MLDEAAVAAWAAASVRSLDVLRPEINGINVYPVADSDTGSNLLHTFSGADAALAADAGGRGAGRALAVLAKGAVEAARGNSGVILSQVLRGLADAVSDAPEIGPGLLVKAFVLADEAATGAVARPVAGTMLTVMHAVATTMKTLSEPGSVEAVADVAVSSARDALARTPSQLPVLARAGVVDAGGRGLVAVLEALHAVVTGAETAAGGEHHHEHVTVEQGPAPYAWEVMYLLDGMPEAKLPGLRRALSALGDSVTVAADGDGGHAVHVHCADIGGAIEAGIEAGRPRRIRVEPLITPAPLEPAGGIDRTVVAAVHGDGLAEVLRAEGIAVLSVPSGAAPSMEEMLGLITETTGGHVTVLAGGAALTTAADAAAGHAMVGEREVVVIPCASGVQVLAALAVHDKDRRVSDDVVAMAEAAAATRRGELLVAQEESITWVGRAQAGDVLGLVDGEVVSIEPAPATETNLVAAAMSVLNRMLAVGGELVTVLLGADAPPGVRAELAEQLRVEHPEVELACYPGGATDTVLLIGVE